MPLENDSTNTTVVTPGVVSPPQMSVVGGASSGVARPQRLGRIGHIKPGFDVLLAHDSIEGTTVNSFLWTQSTVTMTIAQTTGVLTLNNAGSVATTTDAIVTTNRQFPLFNHGVVKFSMRANALQGPTNAFIELGFGVPVGTTAVVPDGAFFRLNGTALSCVVSFNGTEKVVAQAGVTVSTTSYYMFIIWVEDDDARFVIEDANGIPILDTSVPLNLTTPYVAAVSHLPGFARVYNSAAVGSAAKLLISSYDTVLLDFNMGKTWAEQLSSTGRSANIVPTTFAQATQLAAGAAPTTVTATNVAVQYTTLGGEFSLNGTATSENLLGVFGFTVPSPYTLHITEIVIPRPVVTTALGATLNINEWALMAASSTNPSTATGQRYPLGYFQAAASAVAGTVYNGDSINLKFATPIVVLPGRVVMVMVKFISGSAAGVIRGICHINGYYE